MACLLTSAATTVNGAELFSPDQKTKLSILENKETGTFQYCVIQNEDTVLELSDFGIKTKSTDFTKGCTAKVKGIQKNIKDSYRLLAGKTNSAENEYSELVLELTPVETENAANKCIVRFRAYNDGIAYRYEVYGKPGSKEEIKNETSSFNIPGEDTVLYTGTPNNTYEMDFTRSTMKSFFRSSGKITVPALAELQKGKAWVLITEANVFNENEPYCASYLKKSAKSSVLKFIFGNKVTKVTMKYNSDGFFKTPWRCALITHDIEKLFESTLITGLNPEPDEGKYHFTEWVKPFKADWSWWSGAGDFPIEYAPQKDYIDFAYQNGWNAVCLDFGWCLWPDYKEKVSELCKYASEKNVKIMLWYGVNNTYHERWPDSNGRPAYPTYSLLNEKQIQEQFKWAHEAGVYAVKVDYFDSDTQETMKQMQLCAKTAAENRLCVLFHGCTNPGGENRTYPNVLSYEAVFGEEYHKFGWTSPTIETLLTFPFTRNICGSMDYTPAALPVVSIPATAAFQLAETVVFESATLNLASSIYAYEGNPALTFLNEIEPSFEKSNLVDKENLKPAQYAAAARKAIGKDKWFVGAMTKKSRTTDIKLDFLNDGTYSALIFTDCDGGSKVQYRKTTVTKDSVIKETLKENGGLCIVISKENFSLPEKEFNYYETDDSSCAVLSGEAEIAVNPFASGLKEARIGFGKTSVVTFSVTAKNDGVYKMNVYYKSGKKAQISYSINGGEEIRTPLVCSGTNSIAKYSCLVKLTCGENRISLWTPSNAFMGIDRIAVGVNEETNAQPEISDTTDYGLNADEKYTSLKYETKCADEFETNASRENDGFIGWLGNSSASYAQVNFSVPENGKYILRLGYMCGENRNIILTVNGKTQSINCESSGGYDLSCLSYVFTEVSLKKGENTIRITNPSAYCPNIYSAALSSAQ